MLDTSTKKKIDDCRDILVGKLPDPKAQIEQITIGLIYKFMDDMDKEAVELGGKAKFFSNYKVPDPEFPNDRKKDKLVEFEKFAWDKLFNARVTATEMLTLYSEAIIGMDKNPNIPQLFRDIFKNAYLPYRDPETLKMFLKTIGEFEYTHSEKLGDAFEYLLSVMGSQGDAGQFRTPRHIIDFIVAAVDPDKNDRILDPACGTAGFLISAFKYIMNGGNGLGNAHGIGNVHRRDNACVVSTNTNTTTITPDERKKLIRNFVGYDISPDMVRLSLVNLYLHGFSDPHIWEYDTLSSEERWEETYDVILANPPFMSPKGGIRPHKKFSISSNRSEVLFVDYIAEHLNMKGRAGIIVPEGVIFQSGTAYKDLRKMLVDNYLYAVVSLPAGVFNPYSGVKTSILLMDKDFAKKSNEILFVKIDNDGYGLGAQRNAVKGGQLEEAINIIHDFVAGAGIATTVETTHALSLQHNQPRTTATLIKSDFAHVVSKKEIGKNGDYNLSGERYVVVALNDYSNYPYEKLKNISVIQKGTSITKGLIGVGNIPVIAGGQQPAYFHNEFNRKGKTITVSSSGAYAGFLNYFIEPIFASDCTTIQTDENIIRTDFLFHLLKYRQEDFYKLQKGGAQPHVYGKDFGEIKIPLPPLSIQEEIVAEIEGYQKIIDGAKAVVENYKPKIDIESVWEIVELGEVCDVKSGGTPDRNNDAFWKGTIPYVKTGQINFIPIREADEFITQEGLDNSSTRIITAGTILMAMYGQGVTRGRVAILEIDAAINQAVAAISVKNKKIDITFLYIQLQGLYEHLRKISDARGGNQSNLNSQLIKELKITVPPIETQRKIVAKIEKEVTLVNASKQLIEIFEQKIKDRIAKVWGADKSKPVQYKENEMVTMAAEP
jgi:type I restriction enzyme M protein